MKSYGRRITITGQRWNQQGGQKAQEVHLDIDGITLLEDLLLKGPAAIVITHDRAFLDRVVNCIVEQEELPTRHRLPEGGLRDKAANPPYGI